MALPGGFYAQNSTFGTHVASRLAFLPSADLQLAFELLPNVTLQGGYSFLYASSVVRPGNQLDRIINTSQAPGFTTFGTVDGVAYPRLPFVRTDFWAQGLNIGFTISY